MKYSKHLLLGLGAMLALSGAVAAAAAKEAPERSGQVERGYRVASRECAVCHAIEGAGPSPRPTAPPFTAIRGRYNAVSLMREFDSIGQIGHYQMPPKPISKADGEDLIAYIQDWGE